MTMKSRRLDLSDNDNYIDLWTLFYAQFKVGDEIVLITEEDETFVGKLAACTKDSCIIKHLFNGKEELIPWQDIRFISHDGFPFKKLSGADGSRLIESLPTDDLQKAIRYSLTADIPDVPKRARRVKQAVFGDPFLIEDVKVSLWNPGNNTFARQCRYPGVPGEWEECVAMESKDGAQAQLFNLETTYYWG